MGKLVVILVSILLILKLYAGLNMEIAEFFTTTPGELVLSNAVTASDGDFNAIENKEVLVMEQTGSVRKIIYEYIRAPLGKYVVVYVNRIQNDKETRINSAIIKIIELNTKLADMLGRNGLIINDTSTLKYYIKFLDSSGYSKELAEQTDLLQKKYRYNACLNKYKSILTVSKVAEKCKEDLYIN